MSKQRYGVFNVRTAFDAGHCTMRLCTDTVQVCTKSWLWEKWTSGSIVPGFLVGHPTNWALPAPYKLFWWTCQYGTAVHGSIQIIWMLNGTKYQLRPSFCGEFCSHSVTHDTLVSPGGWVGCPSNTLVSLVLMLGSGNSGNRPYELLSPASWLNSCWNRNSNTLG